jgi:hypothetical protein
LLGDGVPLNHAGSVSWGWLALIAPLGVAVALLWQRLRQPNPWLFGPLLVAATVSLAGNLQIALPNGASQIGQWLIGSGLACHFNRAFFRRAPSFSGAPCWPRHCAWRLPPGAAWAERADPPGPAFADTGDDAGGIAEMSLTAETLQLSVPLVTALQVMRCCSCCFWRSRCSGAGMPARNAAFAFCALRAQKARGSSGHHSGGNAQLIGAMPRCSRKLLVRLKCPQPRNPR